MIRIYKILVRIALCYLLTGTTYAGTSVIALTGQVAPDFTDVRFSSLGWPSINNSGEIAFNAGLSDGGEGIFKWSQGQLSLIALTGQSVSGLPQSTLRTMGDAIINDSGEIAFIASVQVGQSQIQAVFISADTGLRMAFDSTTPLPGSSQTISSMRDLKFNNNGDAAVSIILSGTARSAILLQRNTGTSQLIRDAASFSLNNAGNIAFLGANGGIYLFSDGTTQLIAYSGQSVPNTSLLLNTLQNPDLNDHGTIVFVNGRWEGAIKQYFVPDAVVKWCSGSLEKVAFAGDSVLGADTATLSRNFSYPLINNSEEVFFVSRLSPGTGNGIFRSDGETVQRLVLEGDSLQGVETFTFIGEPTANDAGNLSFISNLDAGTSGIFLIDSPPVEIFFPRVADGSFENQWAWRTTLMLSNRESSPASMTVNFVNDDGTPMTVGIQNRSGSQFSFIVPALGSLRVETTGFGSLKTGWARVRSDKSLSGISIVSHYDGSGNYISEVGAPETPVLNNFSFFAELHADTNTAFALANPNAASAQATLTLRDEQGNVVGSPANLTIPGNGEIATYLTQLFQGIVPADFNGTIEVESSLPIVGLNMKQRKDVFTWLPLIR